MSEEPAIKPHAAIRESDVKSPAGSPAPRVRSPSYSSPTKVDDAAKTGFRKVIKSTLNFFNCFQLGPPVLFSQYPNFVLSNSWTQPLYGRLEASVAPAFPEPSVRDL